MSVTTAEGSSWTKGANKFAELVKERTDGKVEVKVFPNEQLSGGNQGKGIEMLMTGATDLSFHSNIIYSICHGCCPAMKKPMRKFRGKQVKR